MNEKNEYFKRVVSEENAEDIKRYVKKRAAEAKYALGEDLDGFFIAMILEDQRTQTMCAIDLDRFKVLLKSMIEHILSGTEDGALEYIKTILEVEIISIYKAQM